MRKKNTVIACAGILLLPLLVLLQQMLFPRTSPPVPGDGILKIDYLLLKATEEGLVYNRDHARHVAYAAAAYASKGKHATAEKWFKLGAEEFKYPSIMVYYGDYLTGQRRFKEARFWYGTAESFARRDGKKGFLFILHKKVEMLNAVEKGALKK